MSTRKCTKCNNGWTTHGTIDSLFVEERICRECRGTGEIKEESK